MVYYTGITEIQSTGTNSSKAVRVEKRGRPDIKKTKNTEIRVDNNRQE